MMQSCRQCRTADQHIQHSEQRIITHNNLEYFPYIGISIADKDTGGRLDEGADDDVAEGKVHQEDMVGRGRQVGKVTEGDEQEKVKKGAKDGE